MPEKIRAHHVLDLFGGCSVPQAVFSRSDDEIAENITKKRLHGKAPKELFPKNVPIIGSGRI